MVKIGVLLSGGVDSSTALLSLKNAFPHEKLTAYYLKIWLEDELSSFGSCPWEEDLAYARSVCRIADVPLKIISLQQEYRERVVSYTISELQLGRTPSPDIFCNRRIKFGAFLDRVGESLDKIASGHYAMVKQDSDNFFRIRRSPDPVKDQTYFLSHLTQEQAALALFPIGSMQKDQVRKLAETWNLPNKNRKDSQGICFLGNIKYTDFVRHYMGEEEGNIVEAGTGRILGKHKGSWFYTIGQRTGLGLAGGPWYVVDRKREENLIIVANTPAAKASAARNFTVIAPSWIAEPPTFPASVSIKLRHGPKRIAGRINTIPCSIDGESRLHVMMDESDRGIAPGQFAVFYCNTICLGGAMIEKPPLPESLTIPS